MTLIDLVNFPAIRTQDEVGHVGNPPVHDFSSRDGQASHPVEDPVFVLVGTGDSWQ